MWPWIPDRSFFHTFCVWVCVCVLLYGPNLETRAQGKPVKVPTKSRCKLLCEVRTDKKKRETVKQQQVKIQRKCRSIMQPFYLEHSCHVMKHAVVIRNKLLKDGGVKFLVQLSCWALNKLLQQDILNSGECFSCY